jgi:hypothetical protein
LRGTISISRVFRPKLVLAMSPETLTKANCVIFLVLLLGFRVHGSIGQGASAVALLKLQEPGEPFSFAAQWVPFTRHPFPNFFRANFAFSFAEMLGFPIEPSRVTKSWQCIILPNRHCWSPSFGPIPLSAPSTSPSLVHSSEHLHHRYIQG